MALKPKVVRRLLLLLVSTGVLGLFAWVALTDPELSRATRQLWDDNVWSHALKSTNTPFASSKSPIDMDPSYVKSASPVERRFDWTVQREIKAPDGIPRLMYTINGQFPGPTIEVTEGDTVVVHVVNHIFDDYQVPEFLFDNKLEHVHPTGTDKRFSIHWHGLSMRGMQVMDGAASFTSCPIRPGNETTYKFVVQKEDVGTHWYHSHVGTSRADGLWGMFIVHARDDERQVLAERAPSFRTHWDEEITIALGDHFHKMSPESLGRYVSRTLSNAEPVPENGLINGKSIFSCEMSKLTGVPCPAGDDKDEVGEYTEFRLDPTKTYRLRLVNVGSLADMTFSVDGHTLTVVEADGTLVEPMEVHRIPIAPGQRYSVILHREPSNRDKRVWMRSDMSGECFKYMNPVLYPFIRAIVTYDEPDTWTGVGGWLSPLRHRSNRRAMSERVYEQRTRGLSRMLPSTRPWLPNVTDAGIPTEPCHDLEPGTLVPLIPDPAPALDFANGDRREYVTIEVLNRQKYQVPMAFMNLTTWRPYGRRGASQQPLLHRISHSNATTPQAWIEQGLINKEHELLAVTHPSKPVVFELVLRNLDDGPHPFHLHGHKFWVLHTGEMERVRFRYTKELEDSLDLSRAMKRDTVVVPMMGHVIIRWVADNPGVWAFHCHMLVHLASGMAMAFVEQPSVLQAHPPVPAACQ
ncbi:oxidoreductase [Malassezia pachydermatis]|uniref:Multicopper type 1 n=1 Tax=Malassezia pachydermatis TaxID=77020 RepID=A0A0M8MRN2_9BASI|nr:multicopper type 1 [Malassezia pachydermatis]KOS12954.1 multicopper type 1 [Malassezia pachydermatis]